MPRGGQPKIKDEELLAYIKDFVMTNKYAPSRREMATEFHVSLAAINNHINTMIDKGWLKFGDNAFRSLIITKF